MFDGLPSNPSVLQGPRDNPPGRVSGAEPGSQEALKAVPNGRKPSIRIVECEVAKPPTGGEIDLGDAIQRDHGHLLGTACDRHPLPCEVETIIDLVRDDDEIRMV